jgi:C4-dicarboxylate-binding protein DctP
MLKTIVGGIVATGLFCALALQPAPAQTITMKIGHAQPVTTPRHLSYLAFKDMVEKKSNGAIKVDIFPAAQLGDEASMVDAVKLGTLQGTRGGAFERVAPELLIYTMPFLFGTDAAIQKVTNGTIGERIAKNAEKNGIIVLATGNAGGFRQITNNKRPIASPDDMKGLKIRAPGIESIIKSLEAFGASAVSIPYGDTYMALKTGVADGQENPFINIESMKFHEVQKYLTVIDYQFHPDPFCVSLKWFKALSPENQKIVRDAAIESMKLNDSLMADANKKAFETIKKSLQVNTLTPEQRKAFQEKAKAVDAYYIKKGLFTQKDMDELRAAAM